MVVPSGMPATPLNVDPVNSVPEMIRETVKLDELDAMVPTNDAVVVLG
jgi:hypothetical protein